MALILGPFFLLSCKPNTPVTTNIYHWKANWNFDKQVNEQISNLGSKKAYVRFFDVEFNESKNMILPNAVLSAQGHLPAKNLEIVPVVYITNQALVRTQKSAEEIAHLIWQKVERMANTWQISITEIQLDCDWTKTTKDLFFSICDGLKKRMPNGSQLSSTLRLHQLKYPDITGVPPVDHCVLMFYNMGNLSDTAETNSILNWEEGMKYLGKISDYPISLSLALPTFSWGVAYNNDGVKGLIADFDSQKLNESVESSQKRNLYVVHQKQFLGGLWLNKGDRIRHEYVALDELEQVAKQLLNLYPFEEIILYHINASYFQKEHQGIITLFGSFYN